MGPKALGVSTPATYPRVKRKLRGPHRADPPRRVKSAVSPEEVICMSTAFRRWQDWTIVAIGIVVFATPLVFGETSNGNAAYSAYIMGALVALSGLLAAFMATPSKVVEWIVALLGVVLFFTPWLFAFTAATATSWVSWIAGVAVVAVVGLVAFGVKPMEPVTT